MIGIPFIKQLFKNVLEYSRGIQGRFFYMPALGAELDSANFDQVIKDQFDRPDDDKSYPAAFLMPPVSEAMMVDMLGEWQSYEIDMLFLATQFQDGENQIRDRNDATGTSTHEPLFDQHDMMRCAINFVLVLNRVARDRSNQLIRDKFRVDSDPKRIFPVAFRTASNLAGVRLRFGVSVMNGCKLEDYASEDIPAITIPDSDPHPEHNL